MCLLLSPVFVVSNRAQWTKRKDNYTHLNSLDLATSPSEYARRALIANAGKRRAGARAATRVLETIIVMM